MPPKSTLGPWVIFAGAVAVAATLAVNFTSCGSSSNSSSPAPAPTPTPSPAATSLTASYATYCVSCHGADGTMTSPAPYVLSTVKGVLKGTPLSATDFANRIRNGSTGTSMVKYTAAQMTDDDITKNYSALTAK